MDDGASNGNLITIGRNEFDFLCQKLNNLENSITDLRLEMKRNMHAQSPYHDVETSGMSNIDPAVDGRPQASKHVDVHGVHMKNVAVRYCSLSFQSQIATD